TKAPDNRNAHFYATSLTVTRRLPLVKIPAFSASPSFCYVTALTMLLNQRELEAIRSGTQSLVFRRWARPSVKSGGTLKTSIGVVSIPNVATLTRQELTSVAARAAGYDSLDSLLAFLDARAGDIYRVEVRFAGADPRLSLRETNQ